MEVLGLRICNFKDDAELFFKEVSGLSKSISLLTFMFVNYEKSMSKSPTMCVDLSICSFSSVIFFALYT